MSGVLLDRFHVISRPDETDHIGVPQIVEAMGFDPRCGQHLLQDLPYRRLRKVAAIQMCEHQIREPSITTPGRPA